MKYLLWLAAIICVLNNAKAQSRSPIIDHFYLKDSSSVKGRIIKFEKDKYWVLKTFTGELQEIPVEAVAKIQQHNLDLSFKSFKSDDQLVALVYLKDSTVFRGLLLNYEKGGATKIQLSDGEEVIFTKEEIVRIVQGFVDMDYPVSTFIEPRLKAYEFEERTWYYIASIGTAGRRLNGDFQTGLIFHQTFGFRFNRWIGVGLGTGIDAYRLNGRERVVPFFAEARGYLNKKLNAPYYAFAIGYGLPLTNKRLDITKTKGGILLHPSVGIRLGARKDTNFLLDVGYRFQQATFIVEDQDVVERIVTDIFYQRLVLRLGFIF